MGLNLNYTADVLVSTEDMQEETWLQYRRNGIGGSDAAAVIGLSRVKQREMYTLRNLAESRRIIIRPDG